MSKKKRKFIIDAGKNKIKFMILQADGTIEIMGFFDSLVQSGLRNFNGVTKSSAYQFRVKFEEELYLVGDGANPSYNQEKTKRNEHHRLCIYTIIGHFAEENEDISVVTGCPTSDYSKTDEPEVFAKYLRNEGKEITIEVDGIEKNFKIKDVDVQTEGMAIIPRNLLGDGEMYNVIDIGGQQLNYRHYDENGNSYESFSIDGAGVNHLKTYLKTNFRKVASADTVNINTIDFMKSVDDGQINISDLGTLSGFKDSRDFIETTVVDFIKQKIITPLQEADVNLSAKGIKNIFTGGGSKKIESYLKTMLQNNVNNFIFSKTSYWDNCFSFILKNFKDTEIDNMTDDEIEVFIDNIFEQAQNEHLQREKDPILKKKYEDELKAKKEAAATKK
jgi:hypothetical protein